MHTALQHLDHTKTKASLRAQPKHQKMEYLKMEGYRCPGKLSWPELVGVDGQKAAKIIEKENAFVNAVIIYPGCPAPRDFRCDRVFVYVDCGNIVTSVPSVA